MDGTGFITRDNLRAVLGKTYDNALIDKMLEVCFTVILYITAQPGPDLIIFQ